MVTVRRVRAPRLPNASEEAREAVDRKIHQVAVLQQTIASSLVELAKEKDELLALMQKAKLLEAVSIVGGIGSMAKVKTPIGRSVVTVDPVKYRKKVGEAKFMESVEVPVTKARMMLGEKELMDISTVVPPKAGEPTVVVQMLSSKE
jgi:hypothetical protein